MSAECHVALASDIRFSTGLLVAATSAAFFARPKSPIVFHIIEHEWPSDLWNRLIESVGRVNPSARLKRYSIAKSTIPKYHCGSSKSPMVYARLLLPRLVDAPYIIYLDSDLLILDDICSFPKPSQYSSLAAAVQDPLGKLDQDCPWIHSLGLNPEQPYFNSGVLGINLDGWRRESVGERAHELLERDGERCTFWDQTALNAILSGRVDWLDRRWNLPDRAFSIEAPETSPCIIHYLADNKPWLKGSASDAHALWRSFARTVARLSDREIAFHVRWRELRERWMQHNAALVGRYYSILARIGRKSYRGPAQYWNAEASHARRRHRAYVNKRLCELELSWLGRLNTKEFHHY
jgi:lipopolysaccharide biosynthesis glycosyltransferase